MADKPSTPLLIVCSAAVAAIYAGTYVYTEPTAGAGVAAGQAFHASSSVAAAKAPAAKAKSRTASAAPSRSKPAASTGTKSASSPAKSAPSKSVTTAQPGYKDGVYTGSGSNVYGQLSVAVTISGGKITKVKITSYSMHYPPFYISPFMNNEVIKTQKPPMYGVSGATASSYNFFEAVSSALKAAKA